MKRPLALRHLRRMHEMVTSASICQVVGDRALLQADLSDADGRGMPSAERLMKATLIATPAMEKLGWIAQRTAFIDEAVDAFLASGDGEAQVVLLGSGYDTRALRYAGRGAKFFEVDLPMHLPRKQSLGSWKKGQWGIWKAAETDQT